MRAFSLDSSTNGEAARSEAAMGDVTGVASPAASGKMSPDASLLVLHRFARFGSYLLLGCIIRASKIDLDVACNKRL